MPKDLEKPLMISLEVKPLPYVQEAFMAWQAKFNTTVIAFSGFVSLEFLAPLPQLSIWRIVQRFATYHAAEQWLQSSVHEELMQELKMLAQDGKIHEVIGAVESYTQNGVTEIFVTSVAPDQKEAFVKWAARIHQIEAHFTGFRGVYVQAPPQDVGGHWITLLQFDSLPNLDFWLKSEQRQQLLQECASYITALQSNRFISPYSGWFASIAEPNGSMPPAWKQSMIVLLVLFPIVMLEKIFLSPWLANVNPALSMFIGNALSVSLLAYPFMPIVNQAFAWWLMPKEPKVQPKNWLGTLLILALYMLAVIVCWRV